MITGQPFTVYRDSTAAHDYIHVDDVVEAFMRAGCAPIETTGTYNIGTGQPSTVTEVRGLIAAELDGSLAPRCSVAESDQLHGIALDSTPKRLPGVVPVSDTPLRPGTSRCIPPAAGRVFKQALSLLFNL